MILGVGGKVNMHHYKMVNCFRATICCEGPSQDGSGSSVKVRAVTRPGTYNRPSSGLSAWGD